ncbi:MAG: ribonuclease Z [Verrucomicrobiales bacterium]|nr:ribonuclease Z [Verrucomicrobiales bacterium]|tara:strand:- start:12597 stop:13625 length:1029 start_codon:yes stop_codon:yes gene_type:complete
MAIDWKILGAPGADNSLLVTVDSGHASSRLLFDCGEGCLNSLKPSEIQSIKHLFFSHYHMDHVSGFDTFFRHNYNRPEIPVQVWGPRGSIELLSNRFRSFTWNLHADQPGEWIVRETEKDSVQGARFFTREAFTSVHHLPTVLIESGAILSEQEFSVTYLSLPHHNIDSSAYLVRENDRINVSTQALASSGLIPGPWLQHLTDSSPDRDFVEVNGKSLAIGELRHDLLQTSPGLSLAYLTDFCIEPNTRDWSEVVEWIGGTNTLICECQYAASDASLAKRNGHMTADRVGQLANEAGVDTLVLQHLSRRYNEVEWAKMKDEAENQFQGATFPPNWDICAPVC